MQVIHLGLVTSNSDNCGDGAQISVKGDNSNGIISITSGVDCGTGDLVTVAFSEEKTGSGFWTELTPKNVHAKNFMANNDVATQTNSTSFTLGSDAALYENTLFEFYYHSYELVIPE